MAPNGGDGTTGTAPVISRLALIERLMKEPSSNFKDEDGTEVVPVEEERLHARKRFWNTMDDFYRDNIAEVEAKLAHIESQVWGKVIVMERNYRTAKAYLRHSNITIDGSNGEFDGVRLGLAQFHNEHRDSRTELELRFLGSGVRIKVDANGNLWMRRLTSRRICVKTRQKREQTILGDDFRKIFDLRLFKESVVAHLAADGDKQRLQEAAMIFIRLSDLSPDTDVLRCPLWCGLIHLIAIDMIDVIAIEFGNVNRSVPASPPHSVESGDGLGYSTSAEESSASSSSYLPSGSSYSRQNKSAVARRIFQQKRLPPAPVLPVHAPSDHYAAPFVITEAPIVRTRSKSAKHSKHRSKSHSRPALPITSPPPLTPSKSQLELASALNGWSLLNLSDIDKIRTPTYFASSEEAAARRDRRRGSAQHHMASPQDTHEQRNSSKNRSSRTHQGASISPEAPFGLTKYKWLSETALVTEGNRRR